jgi:hypothetical protein
VSKWKLAKDPILEVQMAEHDKGDSKKKRTGANLDVAKTVAFIRGTISLRGVN